MEQGRKPGLSEAIGVGSLFVLFARAISSRTREHLVMRGTFDSKLPSVIPPDPSWSRLGIVLGSAAIYFVLFRVGRVNRPEGVIR